MKPAAFIYEKPETITAALSLLGEKDRDSKIIAGGQSLVAMMNFRMARPERLIDINGIPELGAISLDGDHLVIGALARHNQIKDHPLVLQHAPLVAYAYPWVAHGPIRNRGTLCGNLCHADPASEMPALMLALNAQMVVRSSSTERRVAARDFFLGIYTTDVAADEMLVAVRIPVAAADSGYGFHEVSLRKGDFAIVCVCAVAKMQGSELLGLSVAAAGISGTAVLLDGVKSLIGQPLPDTADLKAAVSSAISKIDIDGTEQIPESYRRSLLETLTLRAITDACTQRT
jgi:aerobic carbon-monoxide dehydrogenase medium subunit